MGETRDTRKRIGAYVSEEIHRAAQIRSAQLAWERLSEPGGTVPGDMISGGVSGYVRLLVEEDLRKSGLIK